MTVDEQLSEWLKGNPIHNKCRDECCPDFSCCDSELMVDLKTRQAFVAAGDELRMSMLGLFLGNMMKKEGMKAYIAGCDSPESTDLH